MFWRKALNLAEMVFRICSYRILIEPFFNFNMAAVVDEFNIAAIRIKVRLFKYMIFSYRYIYAIFL